MMEAHAQLPDTAVIRAGACEGSLACSTCHVVLEVSAAGSSGVRHLKILKYVQVCLHDATWLSGLEVMQRGLLGVIQRVCRCQQHVADNVCGGSSMMLQNQDVYDSLPEPTDDENDMLDLAFGLTET